MDLFDRHTRSRVMSSVRNRHTAAEMSVRRALHCEGFRYGLHASDLPGHPDIVLRKWRVVVMVNGCFWHGHHCRRGRLPKSNTAFWREKIARNRLNDRRNLKELQKKGWVVIVIWECQLKPKENTEALYKSLFERIRKTKSRNKRNGPGRVR